MRDAFLIIRTGAKEDLTRRRKLLQESSIDERWMLRISDLCAHCRVPEHATSVRTHWHCGGDLPHESKADAQACRGKCEDVLTYNGRTIIVEKEDL